MVSHGPNSMCRVFHRCVSIATVRRGRGSDQAARWYFLSESQRRGPSVVGNAFAAFLIKDSVSQELLRGPGRRATAEVLMKPFEMSRVVKGHLVPTGPVAGL